MPKVSQEHLERRRQQILDAAAACFARQGFHATSMQDIFAESGLSAGAVYRYFPSKTDLIREIAERALGGVGPVLDRIVGGDIAGGGSIPDLVAALMAHLTEGDLARLRPVIVAVWAEAVRDEELAVLVRSVLDHLIGRMSVMISRLVAAGRLPPGTEPAAAARMVLAVLQGYVMQWAILGPVAPDQIRATAASLFRDS